MVFKATIKMSVSVGIFQEQVLGMPAGQGALDVAAFGHSKQRRVIEGLGYYSKLIEKSEQLGAGFGGGHGRQSFWSRERLKIGTSETCKP